jgi:mono/diheme cytochrome c family protein
MNRSRLLSLPLFAALALAAPTSRAAPPDEAQLARGKAAFNACAACHGADGKGLPTTPPMAPSLIGSKLATAPSEIPITIVLKGIQKLDAKFLGVMAPLGSVMTDDQIADALSYLRNSWGNKADAVTPAEVKAAREKFKDINAPIPRVGYEKKAAKLEADAKAASAPAPK